MPIETENALYYYDWVQANIEKVDKATGGKVGYIHVPNMGVDGLNEFVKHFYPQLRKKALIIDVRGNGGGNVSPMIIERLVREMVMVDVARNQAPGPDPGAAFIGPKVCLCDEFSASDGDIFPYRFKTLKLGKVIGKRTWGGVVGIRGTLPLLDGGFLNKPEFAPYSPDGKDWIIEGIGRRAGHRRRQRPGPGVRRHRRSAQQGHRGHPRRAQDQGARDPAGPAVPDQEIGGPPRTGGQEET